MTSETEKKMTIKNTKAGIERAFSGRGCLLRGWVLDGAGPARYGWYWQHPCRSQYLGPCLALALRGSGGGRS